MISVGWRVARSGLANPWTASRPSGWPGWNGWVAADPRPRCLVHVTEEKE